MIKNVKLKMLLTNTIFKGISALNQIIPKNQSIVLLYSNMGFRDNVVYLYEYMVQNGYCNKYMIIRSQNEKFVESAPFNVKVISNTKAVLTFLIAGHVFYAFGKLPIYPSGNQKVVQMWHGSPFKGTDVRQNAEMTNNYSKSYYTNALSTAECFREFWGIEFDCGSERISICGQPRTDVMINGYSKDALGMSGKKIIIWMPTFRKSKILGYNDVENADSVLPVVQNNELEPLNEYLAKKNVILWVKLHPMQDIDGFNTKKMTNLILQSSDDFNKTKLDLYRLLGSVDALITDYSSVFYDFMLVDKPIAFTIDDFVEYKDGRGFAVENPDHYRTGDKIGSLQELEKFIDDISAGNDTWRDWRKVVNDEVNAYQDFKNSKRALEIGGVTI